MVQFKIRLIGAGGHGILTLGSVIGAASIYDGKEAVMTISYSPAQRGGWSRADIVVSNEPIDYPIFEYPDILVATTQYAYNLEIDNVKSGKYVVYEAELVNPIIKPGTIQVGARFISTAMKLGHRIVANMVILGFLNEMFNIVSHNAIVEAIRRRVKKKYVSLNLKAYEAGRMLWLNKMYMKM